MDKDNRAELVNRFRNGALPSEEDFKALIHSFVHVDEFNASKQQIELVVGRDRLRGWRLRCGESDELLIAITPGPPDTESRPGTGVSAGARVHLDAWLAVPARYGTYGGGEPREGGSGQGDGGPPRPMMLAEGRAHSLLQDVTHPAAFEIVAHAPGAGAGPWHDLARRFRLGHPDGGMLYGIAVAGGAGAPPSTSTVAAPSRAGRGVLLSLALAALIVALLLGVYAAFLTPSSTCPSPWGLSCLPVLGETRPGLMALVTVLTLLGLSALGLLWGTRHWRLRLVWRRSTGGAGYDLCLSPPGKATSAVYYHLTRLW